MRLCYRRSRWLCGCNQPPGVWAEHLCRPRFQCCGCCVIDCRIKTNFHQHAASPDPFAISFRFAINLVGVHLQWPVETIVRFRSRIESLVCLFESSGFISFIVLELVSMFKRYVAFSLAVIFSILFVLAFSQRTPIDASVPDRVLAKVVGLADRVCLQYDPDYENVSQECWSPYASHDNECDWKICADGQSCGEGKKYSNLIEPTWLAVDRTSNEIGWKQKTSPCFGMIKCVASDFDPSKNCLPATLSEFPDGTVVDHASLGCITPVVQVTPGGCSLCSEGDPLPFHADNENWTWYQQVPCNTP